MVGPDGSPCSPGRATNFGRPVSSSSRRFDRSGWPRRQVLAVRRARSPGPRRPGHPGVCRTRTDSAAVAPVVTTSSTTSTTAPSPSAGRRQPHPAGDVVLPLPRRTGPTESRARRPQAQRLDDARRPRPPDGGRGAIRVTGSPPRRRAAEAPGGRGHHGQRRAQRRPRSAADAARSRSARAERADQVGAAVFLDRHDRLAARAGVAAQREAPAPPGRTRGVTTCGSSAAHRQSPRARVAPAGRRRPAAAALQRQDQVEHAASVAPGGDMSVRPYPDSWPDSLANVTSAATRSCAPIPTSLATVMSSCDVRPAAWPDITSPSSPDKSCME